ncbi:MAG: hypothetical protein WAT43_17855 [Chitinophagales bacterium]
MKESFKNGKRIIENNFKDWWNGLFDKIFIGEVTDKITGLVTKYNIDVTEINKIKAKQEELYWNEVDKMLANLKSKFHQKYETSGDKEKLLKLEIGNYDKLLNEEKLKLDFTQSLQVYDALVLSKLHPEWQHFPILGMDFSQPQIHKIRELYYKAIVCGERDFTKIQSPNLQINNRRNKFQVLEVEAIHKYIKWLNEFIPKEQFTKTKNIDNLQTIEDLFYESKDLTIAINALKNVDPPIIGKLENYLLGRNEKGAFTAWIKVLNERGFIRTTNGEKVAPLLNKRFNGLRMGTDGRTLSNYKTRAYNAYYHDFKSLITGKGNTRITEG